jgi:histidine triad (HIT) family protein
MSSPFSDYIDGRREEWVLLRTGGFLAFLESRPVAPGHVVVVPLNPENDFWDLREEELREIFLFSRPLARTLKRLYPCKKVGVAVLGLETPHAHLHLVPLNSARELDFTAPRIEKDPEGAALECARIRQGLQGIFQ